MNLFLIEPCVKILNVINDLLSFSYDRAGGEVIVVVVETSPVEVNLPGRRRRKSLGVRKGSIRRSGMSSRRCRYR